MLEQQWDIFATFTQGRQLQGDHVQAVIQVAAKLSGFAQFIQVGLGGGNHSAVDAHALVRTEAFQAVFLQHPQQFDLQTEGHAFDFIKKQAAAVGVLDLADPAFAGAGEGVGLVAENLAFEQVFRQAAAVEGDELLTFAPAKVVQAARDQLLASAGFALDQHIGGGVGDVGDQLAQRLHGWRTAQQTLGQVLSAAELAAQLRHLAGQAPLFEGAAGDVDQTLRGKGFFHKVVGAITHGTDRHADIAVAGDQHHWQAAVAGLELGQQLQAVDAGQADIADDNPGEVIADLLQGLFGTADADAGNVFQTQGLLATEEYMGVVFDN